MTSRTRCLKKQERKKQCQDTSCYKTPLERPTSGVSTRAYALFTKKTAGNRRKYNTVKATIEKWASKTKFSSDLQLIFGSRFNVLLMKSVTRSRSGYRRNWTGSLPWISNYFVSMVFARLSRLSSLFVASPFKYCLGLCFFLIVLLCTAARSRLFRKSRLNFAWFCSSGKAWIPKE